ncbi:MAG: SpoIIE family protein phosphatase, partial [Cyanobacteria bacterium KgW148]|nr:SpoIIE family protein phosphatase [Cyanobacteria bacterium KgW148]
TPGVEIHAAAIEQLLSSALEGRPLLHTWHDREETIWLFFWGVGGGFLAWYNDRSIKTIGFAVLAVLLLIGSCYTLFIFGYWIPLIPPLFSFVLVFSLDVMYILWQELSSSQKELAQYALVLEEKVKLRTKELELKNIDLQNAQDELSRSFDDLSQANREIENLNQKLQSENLRLSYEVEVAGKIQSMILPNEQLTAYISYDIAGFMLPATEVGGDYYDIILLPDGVRVAIGDVTDHGLESGVIMLMVQTAIATMTKFQPYPPEQVLRSINRVLYQNILRMKSERNLSLILVDIKDDKLVITGQHEEVIILRSDDTIERISTDELGFPIGLIDEIEEFVNHLEVETAPGDVIILFTDGVTEAANHQNELYGIDRLCQTAYQCKAQSAKEICQSIMEDILSFVEGNILYDDITLVVVKK